MFNTGDRVMLDPDVSVFAYGRGEVEYDDIGTVVSVGLSSNFRVRWDHGMSDWHGLGSELIPAGHGSVLSRFVWADSTRQEMKNMSEQELSDALAMIRSSKVRFYESQANKTVTLERLLKEKKGV